MSLHVHDLYYKMPATSAKAWWQDRNSDMGARSPSRCIPICDRTVAAGLCR
jgi:hypothetical protein